MRAAEATIKYNWHHRFLHLEEALEYIKEDRYVEVNTKQYVSKNRHDETEEKTTKKS